MRDLILTYQRTERTIAGEHFYPVHLNNEELQIIIFEIFEPILSGDNRILKIYIRTDKGGKGIDVKLEGTIKTPTQVRKSKMFSFGINANWKLVDFFEHYTHSAGGTTKEVAGKTYYYPRYVANEFMGIESEEVDDIYQERLKNPNPPIRNPFFEHDNWSCIYEQVNFLNNA